MKIARNVGRLEFKRVLRAFKDEAAGADIAVLYYTGRGIQVRSMNYLIPVDARTATEFDAGDEAVTLDDALAAIEPATRLRVAILDTSRNNPFPSQLRRSVPVGPATGGSVAMQGVGGDTIIAYSTKAGAAIEERDPSPFAAGILKHLCIPGLDVRLVFGRIRADVLAAIGNQQEPFVYGSIGGGLISLLPPPADGTTPPGVELDFDLVRQINSARAWEVFIETRNGGPYVDRAREALAKLNAVLRS